MEKDLVEKCLPSPELIIEWARQTALLPDVLARKVVEYAISIIRKAVETEVYDKAFAEGVKKTTIACNSTFGSMLKEQTEETAIKYVRGLVKRAKKDYLGLSDGEQGFLGVLSEIVWDMDRVKAEVAKEIKRELEELDSKPVNSLYDIKIQTPLWQNYWKGKGVK